MLIAMIRPLETSTAEVIGTTLDDVQTPVSYTHLTLPTTPYV